MNRFLLLALTAGLLSPIAAKAEFVLPWDKIEPNYPSRESAMKACDKENYKAINEVAHIKNLIESDSHEDTYLGVTNKWFNERKILSTQCKVMSTKDPNIGQVHGYVSWLESRYQNGELISTPTVENMLTYVGLVQIYFPYKNK